MELIAIPSKEDNNKNNNNKNNNNNNSGSRERSGSNDVTVQAGTNENVRALR